MQFFRSNFLFPVIWKQFLPIGMRHPSAKCGKKIDFVLSQNVRANSLQMKWKKVWERKIFQFLLSFSSYCCFAPLNGRKWGTWQRVTAWTRLWPPFLKYISSLEAELFEEHCFWKQGQVGQRCVLFEWTFFMNECHLWVNEWLNEWITWCTLLLLG